MTSPPPTITQRLAAILGGLLIDVSGRVAWGGIAAALHYFITTRVTGHRLRFERIVERIRAGTWRQRHRRAASTGARPPRPPAPVKQSYGWLMPLIPPYWQANNHRNQFEALLSDPEMVALIQAAPAALGRPLRSLCWMLRIKPPPILARLRPARTIPDPAPPPTAQPAPDPAIEPAAAEASPASPPPTQRRRPRQPVRAAATHHPPNAA